MIFGRFHRIRVLDNQDPAVRPGSLPADGDRKDGAAASAGTAALLPKEWTDLRNAFAAFEVGLDQAAPTAEGDPWRAHWDNTLKPALIKHGADILMNTRKTQGGHNG